ncbi:CvpA family protein [Agrilactobacillus yilanensis]|uniref:CvpA family protein n=1 Tax=Agrilactobacillus yilanensis TaxID=2485997 RepID=A0ABW4JBV0_9LACO|nr:CvpA family protein [Agrilactobacillus yilanensis]
MLSFLIIIFLIAAFGRGWHQGFTKQLIISLGGLAVFFIAWRYNDTLSQSIGRFITTFNNNYTVNHINNIISFYLIIIVGNILIFSLAKASRTITWLPVIKQTNALAGGLLALLFAYIGIFIILWTFTLLPFDNLHNLVTNSQLAQWITQQTPLLTERLIESLFHL